MNYPLSKKIRISYFSLVTLYLLVLSFIDFPWTTWLKPLPIICLMVGVLQSKFLKTVKHLLLFALIFSFLGDIVLTLPINAVLEWGIGFFMMAHCSYILLFYRDASYQLRRFIYFLPVLFVIGLVLYFLFPYLNTMAIPVIIYLCVLTTMVFTAFQVTHRALIIACGAIIFLLSDLILALNLFMFKPMDFGIIIMFTYYLAQFLLVTGCLFSRP